MAKWIIDAGHGGNDSGAIGLNERRESDIVLEAAYEAKRLLEKNGETVLLTRAADISLDLDTRAEIANKWDADYFVSLHMNSFVNKSITGSEVLISENEYSGEELAKLIRDELISNLKSNDRGIKKSNDEILKLTNMPTIIVNAEFISNEEVEKSFDSQKYGYMIAKACLAKVDKVLIDLPVLKPKTPWKSSWRVCIGHFKNYDDVEEAVKKAKKQGYEDAYIIPYEG